MPNRPFQVFALVANESNLFSGAGDGIVRVWRSAATRQQLECVTSISAHVGASFDRPRAPHRCVGGRAQRRRARQCDGVGARRVAPLFGRPGRLHRRLGPRDLLHDPSLPRPPSGRCSLVARRSSADTSPLQDVLALAVGASHVYRCDSRSHRRSSFSSRRAPTELRSHLVAPISGGSCGTLRVWQRTSMRASRARRSIDISGGGGGGEGGNETAASEPVLAMALCGSRLVAGYGAAAVADRHQRSVDCDGVLLRRPTL